MNAKKITAMILLLVAILTSLLIYRIATAEPSASGYFWITGANCNKSEARWDHDSTYEIYTTPVLYSECWDDQNVKWSFSRPMPRYRIDWDAGGQIWHEYFRTPEYAPMMFMECYDVLASMQIISGTLIETKRSDNLNVFNWSCEYDSFPMIIKEVYNQANPYP